MGLGAILTPSPIYIAKQTSREVVREELVNLTRV